MSARTTVGITLFLVLTCFTVRIAWPGDAATPTASTSPAVAFSIAGEPEEATVGEADAPTTAPATNPSKEEVYRMLRPPAGTTSPQAEASFRAVQEMGERAYPALAELLAETDDQYTIQVILLAMTNSRGDKKIPAAAVKKLIARVEGTDESARVIRVTAVNALNQFGRHADRQALLALMDDRDEGVRVATMGALMRVSYDDEADPIMKYFAKRVKQLDAAQLDTDPTLLAARLAINHIDTMGRFTTATIVNSLAHMTTMPAFLLPAATPAGGVPGGR